MANGLLHLFSMLFLAFVVAAVLSLNEGETFRPIARATLRRWGKLVGALVLIGVIVQILTMAS